MKGKNPRIMVSGFYGAGNSGDEAMLRNIYFHIKQRLPKAELIISTEKIKGLWHPGDLHYVSAMDRGQVRRCDLLMIGGGGLGLGFGWNLTSFAKATSGTPMPVITLGCSFPPPEYSIPAIKNAVIEMFNLYDLISVRDQSSFDLLNKLGIKDINLGTDLAIDLPEKKPIRNECPDEYIVVVIREYGAEPRKLMLQKLGHWIIRSLKHNLKNKTNIVLLPFCKEDYNFTRTIDIGDYPILRTFDPQEHKFIINRAKAVVSLGRYHPHVYATEQAVPSIGLSWPVGGSKIDHWMQYWGNGEYCINEIGETKTNGYEDRCRILVEKLDGLLDNPTSYRERILKLHAEHVRINNKQFDDLVGLL